MVPGVELLLLEMIATSNVAATPLKPEALVFKVTALEAVGLHPDATNAAEEVEAVATVVFAQSHATADVWLNVVVYPALARVRAPVALP
jgi:hypothetical protein